MSFKLQKRAISKFILLGLTVVLLSIASGTLYFSNKLFVNTNVVQTRSTFSDSANNGLVLTVSPNTFSIVSGETIYFDIIVNNTLSDQNAVPSEAVWPLTSFESSCPGGFVGDALYKGYLTSANVSTANQFPQLEPGGISCPPQPNFGYYMFEANGDLLVETNNTASSFSSYPKQAIVAASVELTFNGYYDQNSSEFTYFKPGTYTLAFGDIWSSDIILVHFQVSQS